MAAAQTPPSKDRGWLEAVLWSLGMIAALAAAAWLNETMREVLSQGIAYLFTFLTTPFVLEATTAFVGLCIVFAINGRRIAREGDGWVMMEVKTEDEAVESKETGV